MILSVFPMIDRDELALEYLEAIPFQPYPFQEEAICAWFSSDQGVLVCAPTGMGKTLIAEAGLFEAVKTGKRAYYTTPLIALTEQKFREIQDALERWGYDRNLVGLVTGNRRVNPEAPILVVVAEILFNRLLHQDMLRGGGVVGDAEEWSESGFIRSDSSGPENDSPGSALSFDDVSVVVMDEFHNFADYERGIVWEFSLGLLPRHVRTLLISATVGNAYDFIAWLRNTCRRRLELVQSTQRKVPLTYRWIGEELLVEHLEAMHESQDEQTRMTPALVFCFDRSECWDVAERVRGRNVITSERQKIISQLLERYDFTQGAGPKIKQLLLRGIGIHHAGILPKYRRMIEDLFQQKLLSICVCTETLAAGINLPARSVVFPTLLKGPPGEKKLIDSSTAHQIFGRAGRPQYDTQGFVFALAHEDDVKIARFKEKYDQIPDDTKDPKLREMKKKLKKKMPTRRATEQYWVEANFLSLQKASPGDLVSRGDFPWRMLAHIILSDPDIATIRSLVGRRLMGAKRLQRAQSDLDHQLLTLWRGGYIQLDPDPRDFAMEGDEDSAVPRQIARLRQEVDVQTRSIASAVATSSVTSTTAKPKKNEAFGFGLFEESEQIEENKEGKGNKENEGNEGKGPPIVMNLFGLNKDVPARSGGKHACGSGKSGFENDAAQHATQAQLPRWEPQRAYPTPKLPDFMKLRGINPLYGLFLLNHVSVADVAERVQIFESVLDLPGSVSRYVRVPRQNELPPGPLARRIDPILLELGLATVDELVEKTEEERQEEWEKRRRFGGAAEEPVFVLKLGEKMQRLFEHEFPGVRVRTNSVWAAGDILLEFHGDFNKFVTSNSLQKHEGVIFRHLLRMILLLEEFSVFTPPGIASQQWKDELAQLGEMLVRCCRNVDPSSTEETLNRSKTLHDPYY